MIKMRGNEIFRGGQKIGWIQLNHIYARDGKKLGYFQGNAVYDVNANKLAHIEGDYLYSAGTDRSARVLLEKVNEAVIDGVVPMIAQCAIYVLLGG